MEGVRDVDGLLPRHRVYDEKDFRRVRGGFHRFELAHQLVVHLEASRRVEQNHVAEVRLRVIARFARDRDGVRLARLGAEERDVRLLREHAELVDRRGPAKVAGDDERLVPLRHTARDFHRGRSLTGALEADHHVDRRRLRRNHERRGRVAHNLYKLFVNYRENKLRRRDGVEHLAPRRARAYRLDDVLDDLIVDVGFEKRAAHLAQREIYILFRKLSLAAEA